MNISYFYPRWGSEHLPWEKFLDIVCTAGYDGVEIGLPQTPELTEAVIKMIKERKLLYILQHFETGTAQFDEHRKQFNLRIKALAALMPDLINSHTGKEYFSFEQNRLLLQDALKIEQQSNITITHETHRGRFSYAPYVLFPYLKNKIKLTLDISHWFCVTESLLKDYELIIDATINFVPHIHARFGYTQGPQIVDITDPENCDIIASHFDIWDRVIKQTGGNKTLYVTTEVGPWPYMTGQGKTTLETWNSQFVENCYILKIFKERYGNL